MDASKVRVYLPKDQGGGTYDGKTYEIAATYFMEPGTEFTLPHCPEIVPGLEFVGWEVSAVTDASYTSPYTTLGAIMLHIGDNYTIEDDVSFVARYKKLNIDLTDAGDNGQILSTYDGRTVTSITLIDRNLYADNSWNTLCLPFDVDNINSTCLVGATVKTLETTSFDKGTLTMNFKDVESTDIDKPDIEAGTPYIVKWETDSENSTILEIGTIAQWNAFAESVNNGTSYKGKLIRLTAHIGDSNNKITTMVGTNEHPFKGTFDGTGHTLYFGIKSSSEDLVAPFRYVNGATFRNLIATGSVVNTLHIQTGGLIGSSRGEVNISNCVSDVSVQDKASDENGKNGGFISTVYDGSVYFTNCAFTGALFNNSSTVGCFCGFVGWREATSIPLTFKNCLYDPRDIQTTNYLNSTFSGNGSENNTYDNCYYRRSLYNNQGIDSKDVSMSKQVTLLGNKWEVRNDFLTYTTDKAVPLMLSGIIDPLFHNVTIRNITGDVKTDYVDFIGLYSPKTITGEDRTILFVGAENQLCYPDGKAATNINSFRSYFQLKGIEVGGPDGVRAFNMNYGEEQTSSLPQPLQKEGSQAGDVWYTLDGRRLSGKPSRAGVYIYNCRKVVIK